ncbi:MAG: 30S ribosomal protein S1 [Anaerolineae bacterium]
MEAVYIPPYYPPCEMYWEALLNEGAVSRGVVPERWEWTESAVDYTGVWKKAQKAYEAHEILVLEVVDYNKGGLIAFWEGVECFIPASHLMDYPFPADPIARQARFQVYVGREMRLCIIEVDPSRNRILLSERQVEDCERYQIDWPDWLKPGALCEGEVTSVRSFGAFVDLGPLEGMIHISEISWGRVRHPEDFLQVGDTVQMLVLDVDKEQQRVGLSLKRLKPNPWDTVDQHINCGDKVTGTIAGIEHFGLFVELVDGLEGLLHISELCKYKPDAQETLYRDYHVGDPIDVRVLNIMPEDHRITLGLPKSGFGYVAS